MAERTAGGQNPRQAAMKMAAPKKVLEQPLAKKALHRVVAHPVDEHGARILILTADPHRRVVVVPGCHLDSLRQEDNAYFFQDGNALVGMIVEGGTVEYHPADRTYVVQLTDGKHTAASSSD